MQDFGLIKNFTSDGVIEKNRLIAPGAKDGHIKRAGVGDTLIGTTGIRGASKADERVDGCLNNIRDVTYGGPVAFGDPLTSDAQGRAVKADPAAGVPVPVAGYAMSSGIAGVLGSLHVVPGYLTG
ncbi:hypothetical protein [Pseudovibrio sp. Tun.PSC04-5.I4]|uniref:hypothetical protein n=1 Tax=Pseudovibrio sp. Tun.PSC04-5.I4 TaxID=1798213 RepID=UPI00088418AC|nr:hypothetical protein [Pseudovibrio sp. Tun.PSC04-5.I4]SDQ17491.1 hypothetical protein SAMN04515695_0325 [Pseudovibrio sp. Tun.PSC04-5.I4]